MLLKVDFARPAQTALSPGTASAVTLFINGAVRPFSITAPAFLFVSPRFSAISDAAAHQLLYRSP